MTALITLFKFNFPVIKCINHRRNGTGIIINRYKISDFFYFINGVTDRNTDICHFNKCKVVFVIADTDCITSVNIHQIGKVHKPLTLTCVFRQKFIVPRTGLHKFIIINKR